MKLKDLHDGQVITLKSLEQCIDEGIIEENDSYDYVFSNVSNNTGLYNHMLSILGKQCTITKVEKRSIYVCGWYLPIECVADPVLKLIKII